MVSPDLPSDYSQYLDADGYVTVEARKILPRAEARVTTVYWWNCPNCDEQNRWAGPNPKARILECEFCREPSVGDITAWDLD